MNKPLFKYINEPVKILDDGTYQKIPQGKTADNILDTPFPKRKPTPAPVQPDFRDKPYTVLSRYPLIIRWNDGSLEEIPSGILPDKEEKQNKKPVYPENMEEEEFKIGKNIRQRDFRIPEEDDFTLNEPEDTPQPYHTREYRIPQPNPKSPLSDFQKKRLQDRLQQIEYLQRQQDMQDDYTTKLYGKKDYQSEREELEAQLEAAGELLGRAHMPRREEESEDNKLVYLKDEKKQEEESESSSEKGSPSAHSYNETPEKVQEAIDDYKRENPKKYNERLEELKRNGSEEFQPEQTDHGGGSALDIAKNTGKYTLENAREKVSSLKERGSNFVNSIKSFFAGKENKGPLPDQSNSNKTVPSLEDWQKRDQEYQKNKQPHCNTTLGIELKPRGINLPFDKDMNGIIKEIEKSSDWKTLPRKENETLDHKTANDIAQTGKTVIAPQTGTEENKHGHGVVLTGNKRMKNSPNWGNVEVPEIKGSKGTNPVETCYFNWHFKKANENNIEYRVYQGQQTNEDK